MKIIVQYVIIDHIIMVLDKSNVSKPALGDGTAC